ncbi:AEC family transporter [Clostridium sp. C105KSO13]|uniref:AEC family transporter n=1 Tax=Clostridium sp. C105KSO13 TaxID=1776045 RepID=UPI000740819E|nr:AEC family transporter [Clostridium sp. C105KSO13]CUX22658.1 Membrane transport protein [Clostridium sp. C105KSO13]
MDNLIFCLNATVPIFLLMILGLILKKIGWTDDVFAEKMNEFVFLVPLPVLLFEDLATVDFAEVWNLKFVLFCFVTTFISITLAAAVSFLWRDKSIQGEFIQASYRSSAALLGIAFIHNIYGNAGMAPLMIISSVPLYNVMAVVVLSFFQPDRKKLDRGVWIATLKGIVKNPIIIGIAAGFLWSGLKLPLPPVMEKTISNIGAVATPMGLMAMGATFDVRKAFGKAKPAIVAAAMKLVGFTAIFLPLAVWMGFRGEELVAILIMLGSASTVSCFVMAKNMGHEGVLTSSVVMLTTMFSALTVTGWLYILKSFSMI